MRETDSIFGLTIGSEQALARLQQTAAPEPVAPAVQPPALQPPRDPAPPQGPHTHFLGPKGSAWCGARVKNKRTHLFKIISKVTCSVCLRLATDARKKREAVKRKENYDRKKPPAKPKQPTKPQRPPVVHFGLSTGCCGLTGMMTSNIKKTTCGRCLSLYKRRRRSSEAG